MTEPEALVDEPGDGDEVRYRLRDWLVSRQRYWGTPIPIIHCGVCGPVAVPDEQLPVALPTKMVLEDPSGRSPLASVPEWVETTCPRCSMPAQRDTDTLDTFFDSSWYFLRYCSPTSDKVFERGLVDELMPVDEYIGGKEHSTGHLMYARVMTRILFDLGLVGFVEPFKRLTNQGQVLKDGKAMSKSLGNLVDLGEQVSAWGPDAVRVAMLFAGPIEDDIDWKDVNLPASAKWLERVKALTTKLGGTGIDATLETRMNELMNMVSDAMDNRRFNVAIARMMEETNALRSATASASFDWAVGVLARQLSCVALTLAQSIWAKVGNGGVEAQTWPAGRAGGASSVQYVVAVNGKKVGMITTSVGRSEPELEEEARTLAAGRLAGRQVRNVIIRPRMINLVA